MVKSSPSNAKGAGSISGREAGVPHASGPKKKKNNGKTQNRSNIVTNSLRLYKWATSKNIKKKKKRNEIVLVKYIRERP